MKANPSTRQAEAAEEAVDIEVSHPRDGRMLVSSQYFFAGNIANRDGVRVAADRRALLSAGNSTEINSAMMPMTTSNSTSVKPPRRSLPGRSATAVADRSAGTASFSSGAWSACRRT